MKLLDRYILKEMISPFLISVCAFIWLLVGDMLFANVKLIVDRHIPIILVLKMLALKVPWALGYALPAAALFGTALAVNRLARDTEITALRISGTPIMRIFIPMMVVGLATTGVAYYVSEYVAPRAEKEFNRTMAYVRGLDSVPTLQANVYFSSENYHFYVESVDRNDPNHVILRNVMVYETPMLGGYPALFTAKSAMNRDNVWTLKDGVVHKLDAEGLTQYEAKFSSLTLDLKRALQDLWDTQKTSEEMSAKELQNQIAMYGKVGQEVTRMSVDWHLKLSLPFACLVLVLCAGPLSLRFARYGGYAGLFLSIAIAFLYRINQVWGEILGLTGKLPPFLAGWSQNIIFGLIGLYLIWREE